MDSDDQGAGVGPEQSMGNDMRPGNLASDLPQKAGWRLRLFGFFGDEMCVVDRCVFTDVGRRPA